MVIINQDSKTVQPQEYSLQLIPADLKTSNFEQTEDMPNSKYQITFVIEVDKSTNKIVIKIKTTNPQPEEYKIKITVNGIPDSYVRTEVATLSENEHEIPFDTTLDNFLNSNYVFYGHTTIKINLSDPKAEEEKAVDTTEIDSIFNYSTATKTNSMNFTVQTYSSKDETGFVGLQNQGATCYMNSLLQSLYNLPAFRKIVYEIPITGTDDEKKSIPLNLQRLFCEMQLGKEACSTKALTTSFGWGSTETFMQHDIEEFNRVLLDNIETKLKNTKLQNSIADLFKGTYRNYIRCRNVDFTSSRQEDFYDIQMVVKGCPNLYESFKKYTATDELVGDNQYQTDEFGKQDADMGIEFVKFPTVLQLHLNRFEYDYNYDRMQKINDRFEFPEEIDLSEFLAKDADRTKSNVYQLFGVLVHSGSANFGHYYAFLRPTADEQWYEFNDSRVSKVTKDKAIEDNYGGDTDTSNSSYGGYSGYSGYSGYWGWSSGKSYSGYMLVYVRKEDVPYVFKPIPDDAVPQHLKEYMERPKEPEYGTYDSIEVSISTVEDFAAGTVNCQKIFSKPKPERKLQVLKSDTNATLYTKVAEKLSVSVDELRLWKQMNYYNTPTTVIPNDDSKIDAYWMMDVFVQTKKADEPISVADDAIIVFAKFFFPRDENKLQFVGIFEMSESDTLEALEERVKSSMGFSPDASLDAYKETIDLKVVRVDNRTESLKGNEIKNGSVIIFALSDAASDAEPSHFVKRSPSDFVQESADESEKEKEKDKEEAQMESLPRIVYSGDGTEPLTVASFFSLNLNCYEYYLVDCEDVSTVLARIKIPSDITLDVLTAFIAKEMKLDYDPAVNSIAIFKQDYYDETPALEPLTKHDTLVTYYYTIKRLFFLFVKDIPQNELSNYTSRQIVYTEDGFTLLFDRRVFVEKSATKAGEIAEVLQKRGIIKSGVEYMYIMMYKNTFYSYYKESDNVSANYPLRIQPLCDTDKSIVVYLGYFDRTTPSFPRFVQGHIPFFFELPADKNRQETLKVIQEKLKFTDSEFQKLRFMYKSANETTNKPLPSDGELRDILKPKDELYLIQRGPSNKMSSSHSNDSVKIYN